MKDNKPTDQPRTRSLYRTSVPVSPKSCLWFAWAIIPEPGTGQFTGPYGEDDSSLPEWAAVDDENPPDEVIITVDNATSATWAHDPAQAAYSGPGGLDGTTGHPAKIRGLEKPIYKTDPNFRSAGIKELETYLNMLVGMFEIDGQPPEAGDDLEQHLIGTGVTLTVPNNATRLFLGFHDGYEWTNNVGDSMSVTLDWQTFV